MSYTLPTFPYTAQPCVIITENNLQAPVKFTVHVLADSCQYLPLNLRIWFTVKLRNVNFSTLFLSFAFLTRLHVRRTDKRSEAAFHDLYEYMQYAEEWFDEYEIDHPGTNRTIYLATDEHTIIKEANEK